MENKDLSVTRLLMLWQPKEPGHQQPCYWLVLLGYFHLGTRWFNQYIKHLCKMKYIYRLVRYVIKIHGHLWLWHMDGIFCIIIEHKSNWLWGICVISSWWMVMVHCIPYRLCHMWPVCHAIGASSVGIIGTIACKGSTAWGSIRWGRLNRDWSGQAITCIIF